MGQPTNLEQYMLELVNAERATAGLSPLAFNGNLNDAAENHSKWMIAADTFSHTGNGGSNEPQRMQAAGYSFTGNWGWAENIAWASTGGPAGHQDEVALLHTNLMNSPGHRANILNGSFREIGIGFEVGMYGNTEGAFATQDFAYSGSSVFLTGVVFDERDGDNFYDPGEGLGSMTVTAVGAGGATFSTTSMASGGYSLALAAGSYTVTISGPGYGAHTRQITMGSSNVKLDLMDPVAAGEEGTSGNDVVRGTAGADVMRGYAGDDVYAINHVGDQIVEQANEGGDAAYATVNFTLPNNVEALILQNGASRGTGNSATNWIYGNAQDNFLDGAGSNDVVSGEGGNDHITGGAGADYIDGGSGYDFARYDTAAAGVQARLDNAAWNTGEAAGDTMYNFEGLVGSGFGDILVGDNIAQGNQIYGLGGNDTIYGLGGNDFLIGGRGADAFFTGAGTDTVYIQAADLENGVQDRVFDFTNGQDVIKFQGVNTSNVSIYDASGGTLIAIQTAGGGQHQVFLDGISKANALDQLVFV